MGAVETDGRSHAEAADFLGRHEAQERQVMEERVMTARSARAALQPE